MTCFIVSNRHISELVREILWPETSKRALTKAGRMLLKENWRAYRCRYGDDVDGLEGKKPWMSYAYEEPSGMESRKQLARWAACLSHQLAEPPDWKETEAYKFIKLLADEDDSSNAGLSWTPPQ